MVRRWNRWQPCPRATATTWSIAHVSAAANPADGSPTRVRNSPCGPSACAMRARSRSCESALEVVQHVHQHDDVSGRQRYRAEIAALDRRLVPSARGRARRPSPGTRCRAGRGARAAAASPPASGRRDAPRVRRRAARGGSPARSRGRAGARRRESARAAGSRRTPGRRAACRAAKWRANRPAGAYRRAAASKRRSTAGSVTAGGAERDRLQSPRSRRARAAAAAPRAPPAARAAAPRRDAVVQHEHVAGVEPGREPPQDARPRRSSTVS